MAEKGNPQKKKGAKQKKAEFYSVEGEKLRRSNKSCPKCGSGIFLAEHTNRLSCGKCGYTDWKKGGT